MRRIPVLLALLAVLAIALAPALAEARAGAGSSMGSRGTRTYSAPPPTTTAPASASPMERSLTQPSQPGYGGAMPGYGYGRGSPFVSGLFGGLIGAGIGGLLFGHGFFGGMGSFGGFFGFLLQVFLVVLLVRWLLRRFISPNLRSSGMRPAAAFAPGFYARSAGPLPAGGSAGDGGNGRPAIGPADYQGFERTLQAIQAAWSTQDLAALGRLATPEMVSYFAEQLAEQSSRGVRNTVSDVRLERGDVAEAWREGGRDYATVAMRFSMLDVTRDAAGRVVDGSPTERVNATELWTFLRVPGGAWVLSAIQQAR